MADMMYLRSRGRVLGPFDEDKLKSLARRGQLNRMHELSTDGVSWQRATHFPHLFEMGSVSEGHIADSAATPDLANAAQVISTNKDEWFYAINNVEHGPVQFPQLQALVASGPLSDTDLVWKEGMANWTPVNQVSGLTSAGNVAMGGGQVGMPHSQLPGQPQQLNVQATLQYPDGNQDKPNWPHRGGTILTLGILSLVLCAPLGFFAWLMGSGDLKKMTRGIMDESGRGTTQAGMIMGMISSILMLISLAGVLGFFLLVFLGAMAPLAI